MSTRTRTHTHSHTRTHTHTRTQTDTDGHRRTQTDTDGHRRTHTQYNLHSVPFHLCSTPKQRCLKALRRKGKPGVRFPVSEVPTQHSRTRLIIIITHSPD